MSKTPGPKTIATLAVLTAFLAVVTVSTQAETGVCVRAIAPSDVVMPDGSLHPGGSIKLCMKQQYSPVAGLHTVGLADGSTAMFLSQRRLSEGMVEDGQPYVQFYRTSGGALFLDAYAVPDGEDRMWLYRIKPIGKKNQTWRQDPQLALALNENDEKQVVLLAAVAY